MRIKFDMVSLRFTKDRGYAASVLKILSTGNYAVYAQYMGLGKAFKIADYPTLEEATKTQESLLEQQERFANDPD